MRDRRATVFNIEHDIEVLKLFIIKLLVVVSDDHPREVESTDDGLLYKFSSLGLGDLSHRLGFHPFGEVISGHYDETMAFG